jgi:cytidine deaminase
VPDSSEQAVSALGEAAWKARQFARIYGTTKVGCAVEADDGRVFVGCNVEHRFRSHDVHAEVAALAALVSAGAQRAIRLFIAAERSQFTPCGSCLDWIFEIGGETCVVFSQSIPNGPTTAYTAEELMPFYPH